MGFSRQGYWSGLSFPSVEDLPDPGIEPMFPLSPALAGGFFTTEHLSYELINFSPSWGPSSSTAPSSAFTHGHHLLLPHEACWVGPFVLPLQLLGKLAKCGLSLAHLPVQAPLSTPLQPFLGALGFSVCPPTF